MDEELDPSLARIACDAHNSPTNVEDNCPIGQLLESCAVVVVVVAVAAAFCVSAFVVYVIAVVAVAVGSNVPVAALCVTVVDSIG